MKKYVLIVSALVLIVAVLLRFRWLYTGPHFDELWHLGIAVLESPFAVYEESRKEAHPPLYFLLLHFWIVLGSATGITNSLEWARALSLSTGAVSAVLAYAFIARIGISKLAAVGFAFIIAAMPSFIDVSMMVRAYSLGHLFLWSNLFFCVKCLEKDVTIRSYCALSVTGCLALLSIHAAIFQVTATTFVIGISLAIRYRTRNESTRTTIKALALLVLGPSLPIYLFMQQYRGAIPTHLYLDDFRYNGSLLAIDQILTFLANQIALIGSHAFAPLDSLTLYILLPVTLGGWAWSIASGDKKSFMILLALTTALAFHVITSLVGKYPLGGELRHISPSFPVFFSFLGVGASLFVDRLIKSTNKKHPLWELLQGHILVLALYMAYVSKDFDAPIWDPKSLIAQLQSLPNEPILVDRLGLYMVNSLLLQGVMETSGAPSSIQGIKYTIAGKTFHRHQNNESPNFAECLSITRKCYYVQGGFGNVRSPDNWHFENVFYYNFKAGRMRIDRILGPVESNH